MSKKILFLTTILFSVFILSSCNRPADVKTQFSEKITGIIEKRESEQAESRLDRLTDDELLDELESDVEVNLDADFANLEKELEQL